MDRTEKWGSFNPVTLAFIALAAGLVFLGCKGEQGAPGTTTAIGTVSGALTYQPGATALPASAVTVTLVPDVGVAAATSGEDGSYSLADVPVGIYTVKFSGNGFADAQTDGVMVAASRTATADKLLVANNPLVLKGKVATQPAGFGGSAQLDVTVSGGTAPYTYAWTAKAANPTAVTLSDPAAQNPTFTTGTLEKVIAGKKVTGLSGLTRKGFVPISAQQLAQMTYNFDCLVTDAQGFTKTVTVGVPPATLAQGQGTVPRNQIVVVSTPGNTTALTLTKPGASTATLNEAATGTAWFIPDVAGEYSVNGLKISAGNFTSAQKTCGVCHAGAVKDSVDAKFKAWENSAHGNHYFKYMEYDSTGTLVWKKDGAGKPLPAPTADAKINWENPGAMTTFQFGLSGAEGSHYSSSCIGCHTTGYNTLAVNGGFDDVAAAATPPWTFPDLKAALGGDAPTPTPILTAYNSVPPEVKKFQGMQCESCHGPLSQHLAGPTTNKPVREYDVGACAVCHDKPSNHDKVALWRQSLHADLSLAEEEAVVESRGTSTSCFRCHGAQGFVAYLENKDADPSQIVRPAGLTPAPATCTPTAQPGGAVDPACPCKPSGTATTCVGDPAFYAYLSGLGLNLDEVQPTTCAACHDPHSTGLRVEGDTGPLANGAEMKGAGSGALCMVCHNTRNGARGDLVSSSSVGAPHAPVQADVFLGVNAYFMGAGGQLSSHAAVKDTCVGCHMTLHPDSVKAANTNHTFTADETICKACHSTGVDLESLAGQFLVSRGNLEKAIATALATGVNTGSGSAPVYNYWVYAKNPATAGTGCSPACAATEVCDASGATPACEPKAAVVNLTSVPVSVAPGGRSVDLTMTFASAVTTPFGSVTRLTANYQAVSLTNSFTSKNLATTPVFSTTGVIAKANWNYWLVSSVTANPAANVIHNPSFVFDVLSATSTKLLSSGATEL